MSAAPAVPLGGAAPALAGTPAAGSMGRIVYPAVAILMAAVVYAPILANYFHADDFYHLYLANDHRLLEFLLTPHGGHVLFLRNLVFALFNAVFGTDPHGYFAVVLLTHLVNVGMLYALVRRFTASARIACFGAGLWGMCPTHEGSLGWYSVYGHVLVGTLLLVVLLRVARAADAPQAGGRWWPLGCVALLLLGGTAFGVGLGVALAFPIAAALLLPGPPQRWARRVFWVLPLAVPALYVLSQALYFAVTASVDRASVDLARSALLAWTNIPIMTVHMLNFGLVSLLVGPFVAVLPYPALWMYGIVAVFSLAVLVVTVRGPRDLARRLWACAALAVGAYAIIAIGRAPLAPYMLTPAINTAVWPRYHYVATMPLAAMTCIILAALARRLALRPRWADALLAGAVAVSLAGWARTGPVIDHHPADRAELKAVDYAIRVWVSQATPGGPAYVGNLPFLSVDVAGANPSSFPGWAAIFVAFFPDDVVDGRAVYFVDQSPPVVAKVRARTGTRSAELLMTQFEQMGELMSLQCLPRS